MDSHRNRLTICNFAQTKIADYHITTLNPQLGMAQFQMASNLLLQTTRLIEGAHTGVGLGITLKTYRTYKSSYHVIDMAAMEGRDPFELPRLFSRGIRSYHSVLLIGTLMPIVANKDQPQAEENLEKFKI